LQKGKEYIMAGTANVTLKLVSGARYAIPKLKADPLLKGETITVDREAADMLLDDHWIDAAQNKQKYFEEVSAEDAATASEDDGDGTASEDGDGEAKPAARPRNRANK
jgi:hypothetical protein